MKFALVSLLLACSLSAQAPIELVAMDARTWTVDAVTLQAPIVTKVQGRFSLQNPSFTRDSYVTFRTQHFSVLAKVGAEHQARLRVSYDATHVLDVAESVFFEVVDYHSGARRAYRWCSIDTKRAAITCPVPPAVGPYRGMERAFARFVVRLKPRQTWICTGLQAQRTNGPSVEYEAALNAKGGKVEPSIARSNYGGQPLGAFWSPAQLAAPIPLVGFSGTGLWLDLTAGVWFSHPLSAIHSIDPVLIGAIRAGRWQAVETLPIPALGWPMGG